MNSKRSLTKLILSLAIVLLVVVLVIAVTSPVFAYYIRKTEKSEGTYEPGKPSNPELTDSLPVQTQRISFLSDTETSLQNLYIQVPDQGYPVYVRVAVVVNWLKLTDCICTQPVCGSHICKDCTCEGCKECGTCAKGLLCENCEKCDYFGDAEDCKNCVEVDCDGCDECAGDNCKDCKKEEGSCTGCVICSPNRDESCGECAACEKYCLDRDECPRCNEDEKDDWDIIFPKPTEGKEQDYSLQIGGGDTIWEKRDNSGFYYHKDRIESDGDASKENIITIDMSTNTPFIVKFERLATAKLPIDVEGLKVEDCVLKVEIIVQTMQAIGSTDKDGTAAWKDAWNEGASNWPQ